MSLTFTEDEYDRIIELLSLIKRSVTELESLVCDEEEDEVSLKYRLLLRIHEEGGVITKQRFNELALEVGYPDLRGPQGMFAYGGKYVTKIAGDRVAITQRAIEKLRQKGLI